MSGIPIASAGIFTKIRRCETNPSTPLRQSAKRRAMQNGSCESSTRFGQPQGNKKPRIQDALRAPSAAANNLSRRLERWRWLLREPSRGRTEATASQVPVKRPSFFVPTLVLEAEPLGNGVLDEVKRAR